MTSTGRRQNITHREDYKSVALWLRLPEEDIGLTTAIANGGLGCLWNIDLLKLKAALYAFLYDEQSRKKHMADCTYFYYLAILGTDPDSQGKVFCHLLHLIFRDLKSPSDSFLVSYRDLQAN